MQHGLAISGLTKMQRHHYCAAMNQIRETIQGYLRNGVDVAFADKGDSADPFKTVQFENDWAQHLRS